MDGSVTFAAGAVGEIKSWSISVDGEVIETTKLGDKWKGVVGGVGSWSGQATANLDYGDAGQKAIIDKLMAADPVSTSTAIELITSSTGPKKFTGSVLVNSIQITQQMGDVVQVSFTFTGNGAPAIAWT
jgi:predicted secreted protein